jgi:small-conductance mechanosensitive channel
MRSVFACVLCTVFLATGLVALQQPSQAQRYPVVLEGNPIFEIQWGYGNFSAEYRASLISSKLRRIADDPTIKPEIRLQPNELAIDLTAGDVFLGSVFSGDAKAAGVSKEELAQQWKSAMERSVVEYRGRYSWQRRVARLLAALLLIGLCVILFVVVRRGTQALSVWTVARLQNQVRQTHKQVLALIPNSQIGEVVPRIFTLLRMTLLLALLIALFQLLLWIYPPTRSLASHLVAAVAAPIKDLMVKFWTNAPNIFIVFLIGYVTLYAVRFVRFFFHKVANRTLQFARFKPRWAETTQHLVSILIVICALLVAYPYIPGSESPAFKGITLFIGVLASIGSAGVVPNMISGIMLTYMDAFEVGDVVKIGDTYGVVHDTGILSTTLRSHATELITIPNSSIWSSNITNFSRRVGDGASLVAKVGIGYDAPWRQVEAILKTAAARTTGIRTSPDPYVLTSSLDQFNVTYELHAFVDTGCPVYEVKSRLHENILDACNEFGVQIMTPAYEGDPESVKMVRKEQWFAAPAGASKKVARAAGGSNKDEGGTGKAA